MTLKLPDSELRKLVRQATAWEERKRKEVQKLIARTALLIEADAKRAAPVDTGRLRSSIHTDLSEIVSLVARVGSDVNYSLYVELGTSKMLARPYLRPAYDRHIPAFIEGLKKIYSTA